MKFNNRENEFVTTTDGRKFFISRSCAVVLNVICLLRKPVGDAGLQTIPYVLINKRGPGCPDNIGMWGLPAGYLDWNESGNEAAVRETWEECGFNILAAQENYTFLNDLLTDPPWKVVTRPRNSKQNVVLHYGVRFDAKELPPVHADNPEEVTDVKWVPVSEAIKMDLAFNHQEAVAEFSLRLVSKGR